MSDDQMQVDVPVPPVENGAACPVPPSNDEIEMLEDVLNSMSDNHDAILAPPSNDVAILTPPPNDVAILAPMPNHDAIVAPMPNHDAILAASPNHDVSPAPPPNHDASPAPPPNHDASPAPPPNNDVSPAPPPNHDASPAPPPTNGVGPAPPPTNGVSPALPSSSRAAFPIPRTNKLRKKNMRVTPKVESGLPKAKVPKIESGLSRNANSATSSSRGYGYDVKPIIKQEVVDLGNDPYYYDSKKPRVVQEPKVGFDRGLEPDHIVGATEQNGKLMFLIAWKNSEVADLLEAPVVYENSPQIAIQFFEQRLTYTGPDNK